MKKTKYNKKDLTLFSSIIATKIKEEKKQLKSVSKMLKDQQKYRASVDTKSDHDGSIKRNTEMLKSMKARTSKKVDNLNSAMKRIANKTYGVCRKTGKKISKQRLIVMPEATTWIKKKK